VEHVPQPDARRSGSSSAWWSLSSPGNHRRPADSTSMTAANRPCHAAARRRFRNGTTRYGVGPAAVRGLVLRPAGI